MHVHGTGLGPRFVLSPRSQQSLFTLPAFRGLGEVERQRVAGLVREIALPIGETIYQAGDDADALYLVVSGAVDIFDGTEVVARYGPGEVFGEGVLVPGAQRAVTTRVALDAVLLVLPRSSLDRLLELHPSLHQRVSVLLGRRLRAALHVRGRKTRPSEIVVLEGWTSSAERRAFVEALAGAVEDELRRAVSIVTVVSPGRASAITVRRDRPDAVVAGEPRDGGAVRERLAAELGVRGAQAPVVLVELDGDLAGAELGLARLADTALIRVDASRVVCPPIAKTPRGASPSSRTPGAAPLSRCPRTGSFTSPSTGADAPAPSPASPVTLPGGVSGSRSAAAPPGGLRTSASSRSSSASGSPST